MHYFDLFIRFSFFSFHLLNFFRFSFWMRATVYVIFFEWTEDENETENETSVCRQNSSYLISTLEMISSSSTITFLYLYVGVLLLLFWVGISHSLFLSFLLFYRNRIHIYIFRVIFYSKNSSLISYAENITRNDDNMKIKRKTYFQSVIEEWERFWIRTHNHNTTQHMHYKRQLNRISNGRYEKMRQRTFMNISLHLTL